MAAPPELAHPVMAGIREPERFRISGLYGTAFPLGGELFLTAHHVVENVRSTGELLLLGHGLGTDAPRPGEYRPFLSAEAIVTDAWPELDLAALRVRGVEYGALEWRSTILLKFEAIRSLGYAYGYDVAAGTFTS